MTTKRPHIDSVQEVARIAAGANKEIKPAFELSEQGIKFFNNIIAERPKADWGDHDVSVATMLASLQDGFSKDPECRGSVAKVQAIIQLRRSLGLHSPAMAESRDNKKRAMLGVQIEKNISSGVNEDDDLIARPTWQ